MPIANAMPTLSVSHRSPGLPCLSGPTLRTLPTGVGPIRDPLADLRRQAGVAVRAALERISVGPIRNPLADLKREVGEAVRNGLALPRVGPPHQLSPVGSQRVVR